MNILCFCKYNYFIDFQVLWFFEIEKMILFVYSKKNSKVLCVDLCLIILVFWIRGKRNLSLKGFYILSFMLVQIIWRKINKYKLN